MARDYICIVKKCTKIIRLVLKPEYVNTTAANHPTPFAARLSVAIDYEMNWNEYCFIKHLQYFSMWKP